MGRTKSKQNSSQRLMDAQFVNARHPKLGHFQDVTSHVEPVAIKAAAAVSLESVSAQDQPTTPRLLSYEGVNVTDHAVIFRRNTNGGSIPYSIVESLARFCVFGMAIWRNRSVHLFDGASFVLFRRFPGGNDRPDIEYS